MLITFKAKYVNGGDWQCVCGVLHVRMHCHQLSVFQDVLHNQRGVRKLFVRLCHTRLQRFSVAGKIWVVMAEV